MNQEQALKILKTGVNVFLTGEPGSGKTYTINKYVRYLLSHKIKVAITASTGIAATHIGGITIHSFSGIGIKEKLSKGELNRIITNDYVRKRIEQTKVLIIDEISMLSPQVLQMVETICRGVKKNAHIFGGMQVVLVGDFFQLPPVNKIYNKNSQENLFNEKARFAYESSVWAEAEFTICYITEQYRQDDSDLISILQKIRGNSFDQSSLDNIGSRKVSDHNLPVYAPKLFSHNVDVDNVNKQMLAKVKGKEHLFSMQASGSQNLIATMKKGCLSPENLYLKIGAAVMFTKNNIKEGYVNGTLGVVDDFNKDSGLPIIKLRNGHKIKVDYADWTIEEDGHIKGILTQIPLRLAWAITVHKSQGISLDEAVVDLSRVFEFGQGYVALSRVRRLSGIHLLGWNNKAFLVDPDVLSKDKEFRNYSAQAEERYDQLKKEEIEKSQRDFILDCGGELQETQFKLKKQDKNSTCDQTLEFWDEGKSVQEIAQKRGLKERTILGHLEKLTDLGKIELSDILLAMPSIILSDLPKIKVIFNKLGADKLKPIYEYFGGKYSYEELRLVRMVMKI